MRATLISVVAAVFIATVPVPARAAQEPVDAVQLVPVDGTTFRYGGNRYGGTLEIRHRSDGLVLVERIDIDGYLAGVREVPFSWPDEALRAQVVAARTYLSWTLARGRSGAGATFGFDICATTACQVYAGTGLGSTEDGRRWQQAISDTEDEIIVHEARPAQTLYSSSSGTRTRSSYDVFGRSDLPYLQPVDSPEAGVTPYERWIVEVPVVAVGDILRRGGFEVGGDITSIEVIRPHEGAGPAVLAVYTEQGRTDVPVHDVRWMFNGIGQRSYPAILPARRPDGRRWPQAILSYTFDVEYDNEPLSAVTLRMLPRLPADDRINPDGVRFIGTGWGHGVGMSQWGAKAMSDTGAGYAEILSHYYGGIEPAPHPDLVPAEVEVGLGWRLGDTEITASGSFELRVNGVRVALLPAGQWGFRPATSDIVVLPPPGYAGRYIGDLIQKQWPR